MTRCLVRSTGLPRALGEMPGTDGDMGFVVSGLDSSSVLGIFVRKVLLKFHTSMFDGLSDLFTDLQAYVGSLVISVQGGVEPKETAVHTELAHFIHHHAGMVEVSPPSLHVRLSPHCMANCHGLTKC